jgi:hypothetical protein
VTGQVLAGLDGERFRHRFSAAIPEAGDGLSTELIAGGRSNLTFSVTDGDSTGCCAVHLSGTSWIPRTT